MVRRVLTEQPRCWNAGVQRLRRQIALRCDPDGTLDERDPVDKVELTLGSRNTATG